MRSISLGTHLPISLAILRLRLRFTFLDLIAERGDLFLLFLPSPATAIKMEPRAKQPIPEHLDDFRRSEQHAGKIDSNYRDLASDLGSLLALLLVLVLALVPPYPYSRKSRPTRVSGLRGTARTNLRVPIASCQPLGFFAVYFLLNLSDPLLIDLESLSMSN